MRIALFLFALPLFLPSLAQQAGPQLSPSEALQAAMDPFNQARAQNNDLTDADILALSLGMAHASRDCNALAVNPQAFSEDSNQRLALGRLCLFGQQFEQARASLVEYLALPSPPERETALILLVRAYLGLKDPVSTGLQVDSLLRDYPYDAEIHVATDQAISANEGWASDRGKQLSPTALDLCQKQLTYTLPLLVQGKSLAGKNGNIPASTLYADALRCATLARSLGDATATDVVGQLAAILQQTNWQHTAELTLMQEALARATMVGHSTPLVALHTHQLNASGPMVTRTLSLRHGSILLAAFTLWSPNATERIRALASAAPPHSVYAITSWSANTGGEDAASPHMVAALRAWQKSLPVQVRLLVVPDGELLSFHTDQFPAGIAIQDGTVVSNAVLTDEGAERMALQAIQDARVKR
jgi:hypothetical protein